MPQLDFTVPGTPAAQGSMRHLGHGRLVHDNQQKLAPWRSVVQLAAATAHNAPPVDGPVELTLIFQLQRPKAHLDRDGLVKASKFSAYPSRPDVDKLARACLDALTGVIYEDDRQVVFLQARKQYGTPGCRIIAHTNPQPST